MVQVLNLMVVNNIKSEKRAASMLPFLMGNVYVNNSEVVNGEYSWGYYRATEIEE